MSEASTGVGSSCENWLILAAMSRQRIIIRAMYFGAHISIAKNILEAPKRAKDLGCEVFQIFTRSPQGGSTPEISEETGKKFRAECEKYGLADYVVHTPYFINLGSKSNRIFYGSVSAISQELERASILGAKYVMTHLGSGKDLGRAKGIEQTIKGLKKIMENYNGKTELLIENSAGAGEIIGDQFEEIAEILNAVDHKKLSGVCFDTCHAFTSGYDLRVPETVSRTFEEFDKTIGLDRLKWLHLNDSKFEISNHKDRHEHIGKGFIGLEGFRTIVNFTKFKNLGGVIETPPDGVADDLKTLKKFRQK